MKKQRLLGTTILGSAILWSIAAAAPAMAQAQTTDSSDNQSATSEDSAPSKDQIVVTGSRIVRPTLDSSVPIMTVTADKLLATSNVSLGDRISELPSMRASLSQANSVNGVGTTGLNILDLRGMGSSRTLVLVNGRRHVTSVTGALNVDINTIPMELLDRIDVVTGGNSSIYGSDAVAGVVNFILKRNFDGVRLRAQTGISSRGDRGTYIASLTAGRNFADDRGNVAVSLEYTQADLVPWTSRPNQTGAFTGASAFAPGQNARGEPATGDGIPDNIFYDNLRSTVQSDGGLVVAPCNAANLGNPARCAANGQPQLYVFDNAGNLVPDIPTQDLRPFGSTLSVGGLGSTLRNFSQLVPATKRYVANLLAHFDVSDAFRPFVEAKFVHIRSQQQGGPTQLAPSISNVIGVPIHTFRCSNPFLTQQALGTLQSAGLCLNPNGTFNLNRRNVDLGGRGEDIKRDTYRVVAGVEGSFNTDWRYEFAVNYGEFRANGKYFNQLQFFNLDGSPGPLLKALDARRNAAGQIVCGVNADANPANDDPACVPLNVFGFGAPSAAAVDYVNHTATSTEKATELVISGFVAGDLSQLFSLPGGPVGFALGAEYRRETALGSFDELTSVGATYLPPIVPFDPPSFAVKEAFGELNLPVLKDVPGAKELSLQAAGRISDYKGNIGTTYAYNIGGIYAPIGAVRFRANYSQSVRSPTLADLYTPQGGSFDIIRDPCDVLFIGNGTPTRHANCLAAGVPVDQPGGFVNQPARDNLSPILTGGNPNLKAEKGRSLTLGVVLQPFDLVPGLSLTVDYYRIKVQNRIEGVNAQNIYDRCYDAPSLDNSFCPLVFRRPDGLFANPAALTTVVNYAKQTTSGIDAELNYDMRLGSEDRLSAQLIGSYTIDKTNYLDVAHPDLPNRQKSELGDPALQAQASLTYQHRNFRALYQLRYVGRQILASEYEIQNGYNGQPPRNPDAFPRIYYPDVFYHSIRLGVDVGKKFEFYGGVQNIFDRLPPFSNLGTAGNNTTPSAVPNGAGIWDNIGRAFYFGARAMFK